MKEGERAVLYVHAGPGHPGAEDQEAYLRDLARRRKLHVVRVVADEDQDVPSMWGDKPKLERLYAEACVRTTFTVLLVQHSDRVSKDRIRAVLEYRKFHEKGVEILYGNHQQSPLISGSVAIRFLGGDGSNGAVPSDVIFKRTITNRRRIALGYYAGGRWPPVFFDIVNTPDGRRLAPKPAMFEIVRLREAGSSVRSIARRYGVSRSTVVRSLRAFDRVRRGAIEAPLPEPM